MSVERPIVIDLGRCTDAQIAELRQAGGVLAEDVEEVMRKVRAAGADGGNKIFLPIVVTYRRER
jgi:hypothetical protein